MMDEKIFLETLQGHQVSKKLLSYFLSLVLVQNIEKKKVLKNGCCNVAKIAHFVFEIQTSFSVKIFFPFNTIDFLHVFTEFAEEFFLNCL